jgi:TonB-dependent SusC/RagA subfamily outer membrane receptor
VIAPKVRYMKNLRSYCLTFILLFASEYSLVAQQIEPVPHSSDSLIIFLNKVESVKAIKGEIGYLPKNELEKINNLHLTGAISGKISGVDTRSVSNGNMNSLIFNMRGTKNPFLNNQPIYVVDGIPVTAVLPSAIGIDMGDLINDWCLDDIESISILKSGEAAALYGNRAGNGVIVIKTRKAEKAGFHVDFSSSIQLRKIGDSPDFQNKYGQGYNGEFSYVDGSGGGIHEGDASWGPPLDGRLIPQFDGPATGWVNDQSVTVRGGDIYARDDAAMHGIDNSITPTPWIAHPDNVKNFFETSSAFANHIGLSWALKKAGVRFSYRNVRADDILPGNSRYAAHTLGGSLNYAITKSLSVFYTFNFNKTKDDKLYVTSTDNSYNPMYYFAWMSRQVNTESMKNYWQAGKQNIEQYSYQYLYKDNPWLISNENSTEITRKNLFGSFGFTLKPLKGFTINYLGGINLVNSESNQKLYSVPLGAILWKTGNESNELNTSNHTLYADYKLSVSRKNELSSFVSAYTAKSYFHNYYLYETSYSDETTVESESRGFSGGLNYERNSMLSVRLALSKDRYNDFSTIRSPLFYSLSFNAELNKILHFPELISTCTV